jgi:uncharacterized protein Usg
MLDRRIRMLAYRLTTAEITYHLPDHPHILQNFIWQEMDLVPDFPALKRFLSFWQSNLEGKLHSVKVAASPLVKPAEFRFANGLLTLQ